MTSVRPSGQNYSFDIMLASYYGIEEALIIHHFQHWIGLNKRKKVNFKNGKTWTYQTYNEIAHHFPFLSSQTVRRTINNLVKFKVLIKNYYPEKPDVCWFAFVDEDVYVPDLPQRITPAPENEGTQPFHPDPENVDMDGGVSKSTGGVSKSTGYKDKILKEDAIKDTTTTNYNPFFDVGQEVSSSFSSQNSNSNQPSHEAIQPHQGFPDLAHQDKTVSQKPNKQVALYVSSFSKIAALEQLPLTEDQKKSIYSIKTDEKGNPITEERILKAIACIHDKVDDLGGYLYKAIYKNYEPKATPADKKKAEEVKQEQTAQLIEKRRQAAIEIVKEIQKTEGWSNKVLYYKDKIEYMPKGNRSGGCILMFFNVPSFYEEFTDFLKGIGATKYLKLIS